MARNRPTLQRDSAHSRGTARPTVTLDGRCSIGGRGEQEVVVTDLHARGCRMRGAAVGVIKSEPLVLWVGDIGPVAGRLKWTKGGSLGVAFDEPLAPALLETLYQIPPPDNVVPLRRRGIDS